MSTSGGVGGRRGQPRLLPDCWSSARSSRCHARARSRPTNSSASRRRPTQPTDDRPNHWRQPRDGRNDRLGPAPRLRGHAPTAPGRTGATRRTSPALPYVRRPGDHAMPPLPARRNDPGGSRPSAAEAARGGSPVAVGRCPPRTLRAAARPALGGAGRRGIAMNEPKPESRNRRSAAVAPGGTASDVRCPSTPVHARYSEVRHLIRDGDLLLFRRRGLISIAGRGIHVHAAKAAWWHEDLFCLETRWLVGSRAVMLSSQVRRYAGRIDVFEVNPDCRWPEYDRRGAVRFMRRMAGRPYGYAGLIAAGLLHLPVVRWFVRPDTDDRARTHRPALLQSSLRHGRPYRRRRRSRAPPGRSAERAGRPGAKPVLPVSIHLGAVVTQKPWTVLLPPEFELETMR